MKGLSFIFVPASIIFLCALILTKATGQTNKQKVYVRDAVVVCVPNSLEADTIMQEAGAHIKFQNYQKTATNQAKAFTCYIALLKNKEPFDKTTSAYYQSVGLDLSLKNTSENGRTIHKQFFGGRGVVRIYFAENKLLQKKLLEPDKYSQFFSDIDQAAEYIHNAVHN
jgi:hypothetical protein